MLPHGMLVRPPTAVGHLLHAPLSTGGARARMCKLQGPLEGGFLFSPTPLGKRWWEKRASLVFICNKHERNLHIRVRMWVNVCFEQLRCPRTLCAYSLYRIGSHRLYADLLFTGAPQAFIPTYKRL